MKNPCEICANNENGTVNIKVCAAAICPVSDSTAFKQLLAENEALKRQAQIVDPDWQWQVIAAAERLTELLGRMG